MKNKRAYTLIEVLVAMLLVSVALSIAFSSLFSGRKHNSKLTFQLQGLQSAHLLRTRLFEELASHSPAAAGQKPFDRSPRIAFYRVKRADECGIYGSCLSKNFKPLVEEVVYEFDEKSGLVYRQCGGKKRPVLGARFHEVHFSYSPFGYQGKGETIGMHVTVIPDEGDESKETNHSFYFNCPQTTLRRVYDEWVY